MGAHGSLGNRTARRAARFKATMSVWRTERIFEARADNLMATLDRIAADVGSSSATIDKHLAGSRPWFWTPRSMTSSTTPRGAYTPTTCC